MSARGDARNRDGNDSVNSVGPAKYDAEVRPKERRELTSGPAIVCLAIGILLTAAVTRSVDGVLFVRDFVTGDGHFVPQGSRGTVVGAAFFLMSLVLAVGAVAATLMRERSLRIRSHFGALIVLLVGWYAFCAFIQGEAADANAVLILSGGISMVFAAAVAPPSMKSVRIVNYVRDVGAVGALMYSFLNPTTAQIPCREDKCGIFGSLFTGFYSHENAAASAVVLLAPAVMSLRTWRAYWVSVSIMVIAVGATGSRTAIIALGVSLLVCTYLRTVKARTGETTRVLRLVSWIPLAALTASTIIFLTADPQAFTGRGAIYQFIRSELAGESLLIGQGADIMELVLQASGGVIAAVGEHGQAPHLLARSGVVGLLIFFLAMVAVAGRRRWVWPDHIALAFLAAGAAFFPTEPGWGLEFRETDFVAILLAVGLLGSKESALVGKTEDRR